MIWRRARTAGWVSRRGEGARSAEWGVGSEGSEAEGLACASGWCEESLADASGWCGGLEEWPTGAWLMGQEWVRSQPVAVRRQSSVVVLMGVVEAGAVRRNWAERPKARARRATEQKMRGAASLIAG